jgi:putative ABC transport system permease protein
MFRLAWKSVKHKPARLLLTGAAVVLGVACVAAIHVFTNSIDKMFSGLIEEIYAGDTIAVESTGTNFDSTSVQGFPELFVTSIESVPGVDAVYPGVNGAGVILNPDGSVPAQTGAPNLVLNWEDNADIGRVTVVEGRAPIAMGEVTVDTDGLATFGYKVGDQLLLANADGIQKFTIVGSTKFGESNTLGGATLIHMTLEQARAYTGHEGEYTNATVSVVEGSDADVVATAIGEVLPDGFRAISAKALVQEQTDAFREGLKFVDIFALVFALIAIFVGAFIIANTFRIIVTQRTREIGLLRALGVKPNQIRRQVLLEALIVGIAASAIGIGVGYLLALGLVGIFSAVGGGASFGAVVLPLDAVIWGVAVGIGVTLVSALLPAIHASAISPMEALRESGTLARKGLRLRNIVGGAVTVAGVTATVIGLYAGVSSPAIWVGVGAGVTVLGVALLSAQVLVPLARGLRSAMTVVFGVNGKLAANNVGREPRRAGITATALMIGVLLLSLVATVTETAKSAITDLVAGQARSDLILSGDIASATLVTVGQPAIDRLEETPGVALISRTGFAYITVDDKEMTLAAVDAATADQTWRYDSDPSVSKVGNGAFVGPRLQDLGYGVGDTIEVTGTGGTVTLPITGLYNMVGSDDVIVDWDTGLKVEPELPVIQVLVDIDEGADVDAVTAAIEQNLEEFPLLVVNQPSELTKQVNGFVDQFLLTITIMLSASLIIAILGVANTLLLSVTERTREIGLLRAVGVRRNAVWAMITLESVVIAVFGALLGIVLGTGFGVALVLALADYNLGDPVIPWAWLGIYTVLAIVAGVLAAIWPSWKASRLNILDAIAVGE